MRDLLRLCLVLHNHQPIGNFGGVFEQAYQDSYLPFLEIFEQYPELRISLHTSGPLMEWLDQHHGDYLDRVARLVTAGRVEIVGGPFYEPILTMIPSRDRIGQIRSYTRWLEGRLGGHVQGMWMPERVWEQSLTADLAIAGMRYTVLDDFHFKNAGLTDEQLHGYYVTEDDGRLLNVFPGSERLRYLIPFAEPEQTIEHLREISRRQPGAVVVFGDDGEKFGTWPDTKQHVYQNQWLRRFFDTLAANRDWLQVTTLSEAAEATAAAGKIYLPDSSYREMTEWALPVGQQLAYDDMVHDLETDPRWPDVKRFIRGGFWRNFKAKYPEANEMYSRMMHVSRRIAAAENEGINGQDFYFAKQALYRGQCNCSYWHGAFGGIYLPHLRNAVYNQLIAAENLLDQSLGHTTPRIEATVEDFNFDSRREVRLANDKLICLFAPSQGGRMYEFDVRSICHNLLATLARRPESYHRKVRAGAKAGDQSCASIHDRVIFKQAGLDQRLQYDHSTRKSLVDHFFDTNATLEQVANGDAAELGDFLETRYEAKVRRATGRIQVQFRREGFVAGLPVTITKAVNAEAGSDTLEIVYLLENLPRDRALNFGVEFNFAGLPAGLDDRYFHDGHDHRFGHLGSRLDLDNTREIGMVDEWLGIDVRWSANRETKLWTFPIETVSQSEGGFELVHQSIVLLPHWRIEADADGRWMVTMRITTDTSRAESRRRDAALVGTT